MLNFMCPQLCLLVATLPFQPKGQRSFGPFLPQPTLNLPAQGVLLPPKYFPFGCSHPDTDRHGLSPGSPGLPACDLFICAHPSPGFLLIQWPQGRAGYPLGLSSDSLSGFLASAVFPGHTRPLGGLTQLPLSRVFIALVSSFFKPLPAPAPFYYIFIYSVSFHWRGGFIGAGRCLAAVSPVLGAMPGTWWALTKYWLGE